MLEKSTPGLETGAGGMFVDLAPLGGVEATADVSAEITAPGTVAFDSELHEADGSFEPVQDAAAAEARHRVPDGEPGMPAERTAVSREPSDVERVTEAGREGGDTPPPIDTPPFGGLESGDEGRPSLEAGTQFYYDAEDEALHEGRDDRDFNPDDPGRAYVRAGSFALGRADPGDDMMKFEGGSEGCRIVTLSNQFGEAALVHIGVEDRGSEVGEEALQKVWDVAPSLANPDVAAHVFGDVEMALPGVGAGEWNTRLADYLHSRGIANVRVVSEGEGKDVLLRVADGALVVTDMTDHIIYPPAPGQ